MRLLLGFPPFHPPTSPPLGIAALKAWVRRERGDVAVETCDWNLGLFRRWLLGAPPHLCSAHPDRSLGQVCPNLLVADGRGAAIWRDLTSLPEGRAAATQYMRAAQEFDGVFQALVGFHRGLLLPYVEQRVDLDEATLEGLFSEPLADVAAHRAEVIGLSVLSEQNLLWALAFSRFAKRRLGVTIALGGAMMSHLDARELLAAFSWLDVIFQGEAEESLVAFVDRWQGDPTSLGQIPGVVHRGSAAQPCPVEPAGAVPLDGLPTPDFASLPLAGYLSPGLVLPLATSRGCYWGKCTFCSHTLPYAAGVRTRPAAAVAAEMAELSARHGARAFLLVDEAISPRTLRHLSEALIAADLDLRWGAEGIRVEAGFHVDLLRLARSAGLTWLYVGVESSCATVLERMDKGIQVRDIESFIAACDAASIVPQLSFIVGMPGTTEAELDQDIEFMLRHPVDGSPFSLLLGSPIERDPASFGVRVEARQRLFDVSASPVHAPRFHFTAGTGLSPQVADAIVELRTAATRPRMRPHLGEVHALQLAAVGFFADRDRPPAAPPSARVALEALRRQAIPAVWSASHVAGCLEALGEVEQAHRVVEAGIERSTDPAETATLLLHLVAVFNRAGRPDLALGLARDADLVATAGAAAHAELMRSAAAIGELALALRHGEAMVRRGYEFADAWRLLADLRAASGDPAGALQALEQAEARAWQDPGINDAMARCLEAVKKHRRARRQTELAERKRRFFGAVHAQQSRA